MASVNFIGSMFTVSRWCIMILFIAIARPEIVAGDDYRLQHMYYSAYVNITYKDPKSGEMTTERTEMGRYGTASRREPEWGRVVHIRSANNMTDGCEPPVNVPSVRWVALVKRGACKFHQKIHNAAIVRNASAVVIYDSQDDGGLVTMEHKGEKNVNNGPEICSTPLPVCLLAVNDASVHVCVIVRSL